MAIVLDYNFCNKIVICKSDNYVIEECLVNSLSNLIDKQTELYPLEGNLVFFWVIQLTSIAVLAQSSYDETK